MTLCPVRTIDLPRDARTPRKESGFGINVLSTVLKTPELFKLLARLASDSSTSRLLEWTAQKRGVYPPNEANHDVLDARLASASACRSSMVDLRLC
jgi:hypothetical protein